MSPFSVRKINASNAARYSLVYTPAQVKTLKQVSACSKGKGTAFISPSTLANRSWVPLIWKH